SKLRIRGLKSHGVSCLQCLIDRHQSLMRLASETQRPRKLQVCRKLLRYVAEFVQAWPRPGKVGESIFGPPQLSEHHGTLKQSLRLNTRIHSRAARDHIIELSF